MKKALLILVLLSSAGITFAQESSKTDSITAIGHNKYAFRDETLTSFKQFEIIFADNTTSLVILDKLKYAYWTGYTFSIIGGWFFGYSIAPILWGDKIDIPSLLLSSGSLITAFCFINYSNNKLEKAVSIYNSSLVKQQKSPELSLSFGLTGSGIGISLNF